MNDRIYKLPHFLIKFHRRGGDETQVPRYVSNIRTDHIHHQDFGFLEILKLLHLRQWRGVHMLQSF